MPVPSDDKTLLTIVAIHIVIGIACVLSGLFAMLRRKGTRGHTLAGKTYHIDMKIDSYHGHHPGLHAMVV